MPTKLEPRRGYNLWPKRKATRPLCPKCGRRKYDKRDCRNAFHSIDHRSTASRRSRK